MLSSRLPLTYEGHRNPFLSTSYPKSILNDTKEWNEYFTISFNLLSEKHSKWHQRMKWIFQFYVEIKWIFKMLSVVWCDFYMFLCFISTFCIYFFGSYILSSCPFIIIAGLTVDKGFQHQWSTIPSVSCPIVEPTTIQPSNIMLIAYISFLVTYCTWSHLSIA